MSVVGPSVTRMIIDCGECAVRGDACADCVVTFLTIPVRPAEPPARPGGPLPDVAAPVASAAPGAGALVERVERAERVDLDAAERDALAVLADSGLVPPLRLRRVV